MAANYPSDNHPSSKVVGVYYIVYKGCRPRPPSSNWAEPPPLLIPVLARGQCLACLWPPPTQDTDIRMDRRILRRSQRQASPLLRHHWPAHLGHQRLNPWTPVLEYDFSMVRFSAMLPPCQRVSRFQQICARAPKRRYRQLLPASQEFLKTTFQSR